MCTTGKTVLYLFNSASRPLYAVNVLNVLAAPRGATTVHRYQPEYVSPSVWAADEKKPRLHPQRLGTWDLIGVGRRWWEGGATEVVFVYVDRDTWRYHPLRRGILHRTWSRDGRYYFRVQWLDFLAAKTKAQASAAVSALIATAVQGKGPRKKDDGGEGFYAVTGRGIGRNGSADLTTGDDAWRSAAENLAGTAAYTAAADRRVVFLRTELQREAGEQASVAIKRGMERQAVQKNVTYELRISYLDKAHPDTPTSSASRGQDQQPSPIEIHAQVGENLQLLTTGSIAVAGRADDVVIPLAVKRYAEDGYSFVHIDARPAEDATVKDVLAARLNFVLTVKERAWFWPKVVLLVLVFAAAALVLGAPVPVPPSDQSPGTPGLWPAEWHLPLKAAAAFVQAFCLLALLRIIGKKPV